MAEDFYTLLGIDKNATKADIKKAYRKKASKYHPDVSKEANAEEQFKAVAEAYEVLKDPEKRKAYDQYGSNWEQAQSGSPWGGGGGGFQGNQSDFSDIFSEFFNQRQRQRPPQKGQDIQTQLSVDLEDVLEGATKSVTLNTQNNQQKTLKIKIAKGLKSGQKIRLNGQGQQAAGGAGDLIIEINIAPHRLYKIDDVDLSIDLPLTPWEAALGTKVTVPTPRGKVSLTIKENTQTGQKIRLKGRGIPAKTAGDLYVITKIVLPPVSDKKAKEFYEQMRDTLDFEPRKTLF